MTRLDGWLGQLGNQDEPLYHYRKGVVFARGPLNRREEPCKARVLSTVP